MILVPQQIPSRVGPARRRRLAVVVAGAILLVACTGDDADDSAPATAAATTTTTIAPERENDGRLLVGAFLPTTGEGSELGQPMVGAVQAAAEEINAAGGVLGDDVSVVIGDEASSTALGELLADGVDAIIGPASSLTALSQLWAAVEPPNGVVVCSPSATSLALDDYPDNNFLFRTVPSDSLQMAAVASQVQRTGARSVAVGYLDDPYGRGLHDAFTAEVEARRLPVLASVGFSGDQSDLSAPAEELLAAEPGVIVVLGDSDDGGRLLTALDEATDRGPRVIVNDSIRAARTTIQALSTVFRDRLTGVAPLAIGTRDDAPDGFFTSHAVDCLNLIALAAVFAGTDAPRTFRTSMARVSVDGSPCMTFAECAALLEEGLNIDYQGLSGPADLANSTGDLSSGRFESFSFDADGLEVRRFEFTVP